MSTKTEVEKHFDVRLITGSQFPAIGLHWTESMITNVKVELIKRVVEAKSKTLSHLLKPPILSRNRATETFTRQRIGVAINSPMKSHFATLVSCAMSKWYACLPYPKYVLTTVTPYTIAARHCSNYRISCPETSTSVQESHHSSQHSPIIPSIVFLSSCARNKTDCDCDNRKAGQNSVESEYLRSLVLITTHRRRPFIHFADLSLQRR